MIRKPVLDLIKKHSQLAREKSVSEILVAFLNDSGYLKYLLKIPQDSGEEKLDLLINYSKKI